MSKYSPPYPDRSDRFIPQKEKEAQAAKKSK
jgi:hypothetical protein